MRFMLKVDWLLLQLASRYKHIALYRVDKARTEKHFEM